MSRNPCCRPRSPSRGWRPATGRRVHVELCVSTSRCACCFEGPCGRAARSVPFGLLGARYVRSPCTGPPPSGERLAPTSQSGRCAPAESRPVVGSAAPTGCGKKPDARRRGLPGNQVTDAQSRRRRRSSAWRARARLDRSDALGCPRAGPTDQLRHPPASGARRADGLDASARSRWLRRRPCGPRRPSRLRPGADASGGQDRAPRAPRALVAPSGVPARRWRRSACSRRSPRRRRPRSGGRAAPGRAMEGVATAQELDLAVLPVQDEVALNDQTPVGEVAPALCEAAQRPEGRPREQPVAHHRGDRVDPPRLRDPRPPPFDPDRGRWGIRDRSLAKDLDALPPHCLGGSRPWARSVARTRRQQPASRPGSGGAGRAARRRPCRGRIPGPSWPRGRRSPLMTRPQCSWRHGSSITVPALPPGGTSATTITPSPSAAYRVTRPPARTALRSLGETRIQAPRTQRLTQRICVLRPQAYLKACGTSRSVTDQGRGGRRGSFSQRGRLNPNSEPPPGRGRAQIRPPIAAIRPRPM